MADLTDAERLIAAITAAGPGLDPEETFWDTLAVNPTDHEVHTWMVRLARFTRRMATVYRLADGSLVAIEQDRGATERQEPTPSATAYVVEPYEVTVTRYRKPLPPAEPAEETSR
ncbi:MAG TPA: hypothetical protein VNO31_09430 [Umezawaea sp.]|nr:hypothetical protein [Umezawaea sp.]